MAIKRLFDFAQAKGTTRVSGLPIKVNFGFTLAEVLITLGIIGVVAALTIPNLMTAHKKHKIEVNKSSFYNQPNNQAIRNRKWRNGNLG